MSLDIENITIRGTSYGNNDKPIIVFIKCLT